MYCLYPSKMLIYAKMRTITERFVPIKRSSPVKTVRLYYTDPMLSTFNATVLSCTPAAKGGFIVVLDKTAFFPEGGGQECDTGVLIYREESAELRVLHVTEGSDGVISHLCDKEIAAGSTVTGKLFFEKRFSNMQHHSGEHIMSGLIKTLFDKDNVGFHLSGGSAVFDIAGTFTDEELALLEKKANEAIANNLDIVTKIVGKDELKNISCRSKFYDSGESGTDTPRALSGDGADENPLNLPGERSARNLLALPDEIRIVTIGDVDSCACCAPHVKTTGQIGLIKIMNAEHFRGGTRFTIVCGQAALEAMCKLRNDELKIMHMLSAKQGETPEAVKRLSDSLAALKQSLYSKDEQIASMLMQNARATGSRVFFSSDIDQNIARKCVNELTAQDPSSPVFFFTGNDENGYRFIIGGGRDARDVLGKLKTRIDIKGGGSAAMVNGTTPASREMTQAAINMAVSETHGPRMILASASPRRKEILSKLGIPFEIIVSGADETSSTSDPRELVKELALLKASDVLKNCPEGESVIVIGSDTVVDLKGKILGKPRDKNEAEEMLKGLSGNSHKVHTGLAVLVRDEKGELTVYNETETSVVNVVSLTPEEIEAYTESGEPYDKAGSYAIQGLFAPYISSIEGDYYNIVGLPLCRLHKIIRKYY